MTRRVRLRLCKSGECEVVCKWNNRPDISFMRDWQLAAPCYRYIDGNTITKEEKGRVHTHTDDKATNTVEF